VPQVTSAKVRGNRGRAWLKTGRKRGREQVIIVYFTVNCLIAERRGGPPIYHKADTAPSVNRRNKTHYHNRSRGGGKLIGRSQYFTNQEGRARLNSPVKRLYREFADRNSES